MALWMLGVLPILRQRYRTPRIEGRSRVWALTMALVSLAALVAAPAQAQMPRAVTIGAAPVGGVYYVWGAGFADLLSETLGIQASVRFTGGPVHNIKLLDSKQLDFGMLTTAPAWEAWHGQGWAQGRTYRNVRAIFPMYTSYFQMYALRRSGIRSLADLSGKHVGVGPVGGTPATYWPLIFEVANIQPARMVNAASAFLDSRLKNGLLDANGQSLGLPWPILAQAETTHELVIFGVPKDLAEVFVRKYPYFTTGEIPGNTYKSQQEPIRTLTLGNFMAVHRDASEELVYKVLKATFERTDILIAAHSSAREIKAETIVTSPIPLHRAAVRFFREKGITLPGRLVEAQ